MNNFGFTVFNTLPHFSKKRFQLGIPKIWKKSEKCHCQTLRTFVFDNKVASKPFSKKLPMNNL